MASMAALNSDVRGPSIALSTSTVRNMPAAPHTGARFADFQFRTIGQQPELLKRISAPDPDMQYDHDSDLHSSSLPDQSKAVTPPESDSAKRPSLQDRLSLLESPPTRRDENVDVTMANPLELRPAFDLRTTQNVSSMATQPARPYAVNSSPQSLRTPFPQNRGLRKESDLHDMVYKEKAIKKAGAASASSESRFPIITGSQTENRMSPPFVQSSESTQASAVSSQLFSGETIPSLTALRTLQSRISSSLSNFNPISTANALAAAQSAKDQCTEILATAHRAHTLAQQASLLAQDATVATQECLTVAAAVQNRADLALSAVEKIRSGQEIGTNGESEYNANVKALKDDLHQLTEWVSQWDAYESKRQLEERENEKRKKKLALQLEHDLNKFSAKKQTYGLMTLNDPSAISIRDAVATTVEDEADAATRAWNQHREQSVERKRLAEEELRKREADAEHERQRLQVQSERHAELEKKLQAEKRKAEEEQKSRQEKEALGLQRQQQEMEIARFLQSQKQVQDDLAKVAAEEKRRKAEAEKEAHLIAEHEQKRREIHEKELLKCHHDSEANRDVILEGMKRLAVEAQPPVSADTVANISDKVKEKQPMSTLPTPSSQHPTCASSLPSGPSHAELGNVVAKKTLLTNSPQTMQQNRSLPCTITLHESPNSTIPTSSISSTPRFSTVMQNGTKSHEVPLDIPSSIDKRLLPDSSTARMPSNHIHEVDHKSGDGACNIDSSSLSSSLSSLPPLTPSVSPVLNPPATTSSTALEDIHSEINIHSSGPDVGNVSIVPPSRIPPVSLEAQRANLRPFMDANGITCGPEASDLNERKPPSGSADQSSVTTEMSRRKPLSSSQMNGDQLCSVSSTSIPGTEKRLKLEPIHDVSVLSMPPLPAPPIIKPAPTRAAKPKLPDFKKIRISPTAAAHKISPSSKEIPASARTIPLVQPPEPAVTQLDGSASADSSILSKEKEKEKGRPAAVRRNLPPLASNGQPSSLEDAMNQAFQDNDSQLPVSPRMGPDAAMTDGWAPSVGDDSMAKGQRKQLPRSLDHSPPRTIIPPPGSRLPPKRPRARFDHYSPPRSLNDYARDRRRSGSVEHLRGGLSPQSKYNDDHRLLLSDDMPPTIGRKRYRDDDSDDAPLPRRPRFSPPFRQDNYVQPSLALRLESEKPWNSHGGSSYRPIYSESNSYVYDTQGRNIKNQRYSAFRSQPIPQGSSYDVSTQSNQQRQSGRNDNTNDTRLPLLSRFTDSTEQILPPSNKHHGPTSPRMQRGPRGGNQALEQRISKPKAVPLINRLEDAN